MNALNKFQLQSLYEKRSKRYDFTANLYYLIGFREYAYRRKAVDALNLHQGDTVVEVSCGTGLNFPLLQKSVGPKGRIIGVDLTEAMLKQAQRRVEDHQWKNVELIHCDAAQYGFPDGIDGVISTFAITLIPEFDQIINNGAQALKTNKGFVVLDFRLPTGALAFLAPVAAAIMKPFGVSLDLADRHPWESIRHHMQNLDMETLFGGFTYVATGRKR